MDTKYLFTSTKKVMYLLCSPVCLFAQGCCCRGHGGPVVTHLPPISHRSLNNGPYAGKLVVAYQWLAVYSIEP